MTFTHLSTQYLIQSNIFDFWVVISNICMASSSKALAVLSKSTWHPSSDLCMSMYIKENEPSYNRQDHIYLPNVHDPLEDTVLPSTFPMQYHLSASPLHTLLLLWIALLEVNFSHLVWVFENLWPTVHHTLWTQPQQGLQFNSDYDVKHGKADFTISCVTLIEKLFLRTQHSTVVLVHWNAIPIQQEVVSHLLWALL